ncbi:MAG: DNA polymerase Y family protein [Pseudomonadota bacterium]
MRQRRKTAAEKPSFRSDAHPEAKARAPLAVYAKMRNALRLIAVDAEAERRGLTSGLPLADARARVPDLDAVEEEEKADRALLETMADWCDRYTPLVAGDPPDGLFLDISGCAHLFGGEATLLADLVGRLRRQGLAVRAAIAGTPAAAGALARFGDQSIVMPGAERAAIVSLPVAALRVPAETIDGLAQMGLRRIADILNRPRAPLAARFGLDLIARLDAVAGAGSETLSPRLPLPALVAERRFAEGILDKDAVLSVIRSLTATLAETLTLRGEGARVLEAALFRVDGAVTRVRVGTGRPLRDPDLAARLFSERLKGTETEIDGGFGFDLIRLSVLETASDAPRQIDMSGNLEADESVHALIDRLGARVGLDNVLRYRSVDSHVPEIEATMVPAALMEEADLGWPEADQGADLTPLARPIRFFTPPEPIETLAEVPEGPPIRFRWRKVSYDVRLAEGPERIAPPWWQGDPAPVRDYFRVEDGQGRRFWLFREGLYETRGGEASPAGPPRWFMQGLFP